MSFLKKRVGREVVLYEYPSSDWGIVIEAVIHLLEDGKI